MSILTPAQVNNIVSQQLQSNGKGFVITVVNIVRPNTERSGAAELSPLLSKMTAEMAYCKVAAAADG